jgi:hypothetical protein
MTDRPNVLFFITDQLRADHLGCYGYGRPTSPAIDRLAAEGALFENGWAHAPSTRYSMPALLTGRLPLDVSPTRLRPALRTGRDHGRHPGILLRVPGAFLRRRQLDQIAADACRLDNRKLVARDVSYFFGERTALCADALPDFHLVRFRQAEPFLPRNHNDGVASFSRPIHRTFRPRLVGFLIRNYILQAPRRAQC